MSALHRTFFHIDPVRPVAELLPIALAAKPPHEAGQLTPRAYPNYAGGTAGQRRLRDLLRARMEAAGFSVYEFAWWRFDYREWTSYGLRNVRCEDVRPQGGARGKAS